MPLGLDFIEQIRHGGDQALPYVALQLEDWAARLAPIVPIIDSMSALASGYLKVTTTANVTMISSVAGVAAIDVTTGTIAAARFPAFTGDVTTAAGAINTAIGVGKVTNAMLATTALVKTAARSAAQTAAVASVAAYTVGAADGSFVVSANVLITTATTHNFTVTCAYTDEGNTARVLTFNFSSLAGVLATAIVNTGGAVPYEGVPMHIRCKAATAITIATTGTFTTVVYNVDGLIAQMA